MEESFLSSSIEMLEKDYDDVIRKKGELDERIFINEEDTLLGSGSLSGGAMNMNAAKVCFLIKSSFEKSAESCSCMKILFAFKGLMFLFSVSFRGN